MHMDELTNIIGQEPTHYEGGFLVDTQDKAVWCSGKIRNAEARLAALKAAKDEYIRRIEEWYEGEKKEHENTVNRMMEFLRPWVASEIAHGTKKSVKLPDGAKAGFRASPPRVEIGDMEEVVAWAESKAPSIVQVKKHVNKTDIKKLIEEKGEVPPTVEIVPNEGRFYVDVRDEGEV